MTHIRFTETMSGHIALGATEPASGDAQGRADGTTLTLTLTIAIADVDAFISDGDHAATATGWVDCDALGGRLPVERGRFNLFVADSPVTRRMRYRLWFRDSVGHPLTLTGVKHIGDHPEMNAWADTTTLYTWVRIGHVDDANDMTAEVTAAGVLHISIPSFARQLTTFRASRGCPASRAAGTARFGEFFCGELWKVYGRRMRSLAGAGL